MLDRAEAATDTPRHDRLRTPGAAGVSGRAPIEAAALLAILRRRKWLLLASILLCPLLTAIAIARLTPRYTASGTCRQWR